MPPLHAGFLLRQILFLVLGGLILSGWTSSKVHAASSDLDDEFRRSGLKAIQDCLKNKDIDPPPPPLQKIDKCETILGVKRDGTEMPCHQVANGSCEVQ